MFLGEGVVAGHAPEDERAEQDVDDIVDRDAGVGVVPGDPTLP